MRVMTTNDDQKSKEQLLVEKFMARMNHPMQPLPTAPEIPSLAVRKLRARLMLEEVLEVIELGLGLQVQTGNVNVHDYVLVEKGEPNLAEIAGNLADLDVVGPLGTAAVCGLAQRPFTLAVCGNNLLKFAPGHTFREDGKLVKPPNHPKVEDLFTVMLATQGYKWEVK